jgi:RND family efflux transporter MFP subunit
MRFLFGGTVMVLLLAGILIFLILHHRSHIRHEEAQLRKVQQAGPVVVVVVAAHASPPERTLVLQAEARPFLSATLYAKVSGYLREITVDKGDQVTANQVLALIEAPEIDRQYQAALADANYKRANARRYENLVGSGVVSVQDADLAVTQSDVSVANLRTQGTQRAYEVLRAPFNGTVTARFADPGALVQNATSAQTGALPVVTVAQLDRLRVYVYLAQADAAFVHVGNVADIRVPERPGRTYKASVTRISGELDPRTRMMLTELDVDNQAGEIVPGSFIEASLAIKTPPYVEIPSEALVLRNDTKTFVAVVSPDRKVHFQPVIVAYDDGQVVRLISGLSAGQKVALNLGDSVAEGAIVRPESSPQAGQKAQAGGQQENNQGQKSAPSGAPAGTK